MVRIPNGNGNGTPLLERPLTVGHALIGAGLFGGGLLLGSLLFGGHHDDEDERDIVIVDTE